MSTEIRRPPEEMRRQGGVGGSGGHYGGDGNPQHAYLPPPPQMQMQQQEQHHPQQQSKSDQHHNQWRWDKDGPKVQSPMSPHMFNEGNFSFFPYNLYFLLYGFVGLRFFFSLLGCYNF